MPSGKLDPQVEAFLQELEDLNAPPLETLTPEEARLNNIKTKQRLGGVSESVAKVEDHQVPTDEVNIPIRIYKPEGEAPFPVFVFFHGGGWVTGDLDTHDALCRSICNATPCMVVAVDYRLAPEHKFPAAVEDAIAATQWVFDHITSFGGNPEKVAIGGDSAGGTLATVVAQHLKGIIYQVLIYPVIDLSNLDTESYLSFADGYLLTRNGMAWFRDHYLKNEADATHPDASPLLIEDLRKQPPALIITAEFDPLLDEAEAYAKRLKESGVSVDYVCFDGMIHAFMTLAVVIDRARDGIELCAKSLQKAFVGEFSISSD